MNLTLKYTSPHLDIYKPQFNSVLSVLYRVTGIVSFVFLLLTIYLSTEYFQVMGNILDIVIYSFTLFLIYHIYMGISMFEIFPIRPIQFILYDNYENLDQLSKSYYTHLYLCFLISIVFLFL